MSDKYDCVYYKYNSFILRILFWNWHVNRGKCMKLHDVTERLQETSRGIYPTYDRAYPVHATMHSITHDWRSTIFEYSLQCIRIVILISHRETCIRNFLTEFQVIILYRKSLISKPTNVGIDLKRKIRTYLKWKQLNFLFQIYYIQNIAHPSHKYISPTICNKLEIQANRLRKLVHKM